MSQPIVEALTYFTALSFDIMSFLIIERLAATGRPKIKEDGMNISDWLQVRSSSANLPCTACDAPAQDPEQCLPPAPKPTAISLPVQQCLKQEPHHMPCLWQRDKMTRLGLLKSVSFRGRSNCYHLDEF